MIVSFIGCEQIVPKFRSGKMMTFWRGRAKRSDHKPLASDAADLALSRLDKYRNATGGTPTAKLRLEMQHTMQKHAAVFRDSALLADTNNMVLGVTRMPRYQSIMVAPGLIAEHFEARYRRRHSLDARPGSQLLVTWRRLPLPAFAEVLEQISQ